MADQFEQDFINAEQDPTPEGHTFRADFVKMITNGAKDPAPGSLGDTLKGLVKEAVAEALPPLLKSTADLIVQQLTSDPGPEADFLYKRIADGVWEQLNKYGLQIGYNPKPPQS